MKPIREKTMAMPLRCLRPRCQNAAVSRGLCPSDYQVAYQLVTSGVTTWDDLLANGKIAEPRRDAKSWFLETRRRSA